MKAKQKIHRILPYALLIFVFVLATKYWDSCIQWIGILISVCMPLFIGAAIAYILNILLSFYERKFLLHLGMFTRFKRMISLLLSLITLALIIALIMLMIIPQMQNAITGLVESVPAFIDSIYRFLSSFSGSFVYQLLESQIKDLQLSSVNITKAIEQLIKWAGGGATGTLGLVNNAISGTVNFFMGFVFAFYLLMGKETLAGQIRRLERKFLKAEFIRKKDHVIKIIDQCFHNFIVGQCIEACILGGMCAGLMMLLRLPYALMTGIVVGATAIIPIFGAYIGMVVGFVMIFPESQMQAFGFILMLMILQQFENQVIYPRVVGESIGLPGIWIFASVIIGSGVFGIMGMLIFIPLVAAGYKLLREIVQEEDENILDSQ